MEQRYLESNRTITKQYGPKVEAVMSGLIVVVCCALLLFVTLV